MTGLTLIAPFNNTHTQSYQRMLFSLPLIKCLAAPPSFQLLPRTVSFSKPCSTIRLPACLEIAGSLEEQPNISLTVAKKGICSLSFEF